MDRSGRRRGSTPQASNSTHQTARIKKGSAHQTNEKGSSEILGDIVSGFFERSKAITEDVKCRKPLEPNEKGSSELLNDIMAGIFDAPATKSIATPPQHRESVRHRLRSDHTINSATTRSRGASITKADRIRMEAELMGVGPPAETITKADRLRMEAELMGMGSRAVPQQQSISPSSDSLQRSLSPPDTPGDEQLKPIQMFSQKTPSPDHEMKPPPAATAHTAQPVKTTEPTVVRRRARSKEARQAEEKELMREFRRQELSTWLDADAVLKADEVTFDPDVRFVPYKAYVKSS